MARLSNIDAKSWKLSYDIKYLIFSFFTSFWNSFQFSTSPGFIRFVCRIFLWGKRIWTEWSINHTKYTKTPEEKREADSNHKKTNLTTIVPKWFGNGNSIFRRMEWNTCERNCNSTFHNFYYIRQWTKHVEHFLCVFVCTSVDWYAEISGSHEDLSICQRIFIFSHIYVYRKSVRWVYCDRTSLS